jgi:transposase-like protein
MEFAGREYHSLISQKHFIDLCLEHGEVAVDVMKAAAALSVPPVFNKPCPTPRCKSSSLNVRTNTDNRRIQSRSWCDRLPLYHCESCAKDFN